ncbi:exosome complex component RRP40-like [Acanthaster planci]|uniref:Exosome complex component RRP40 n=1 Tax=Acanthaster planci TaxID=133434 RepID=A0A8B7ZNG3_ACAPL|nr:exosome complex component RRP40-like [Acanthaster planci]
MAPPRAEDLDSERLENCRVLPGDCLNDVIISTEGKRFRLGPGLRQEGETVVACKCGILRKKEPNILWIDSYQKRYVPVRGETVLGIVVGKTGDVFKVDIGGSVPASLSYLAFEGATKRNRPNVVIGDVVFGRLLVANRDMEPDLVCMDSGGRSAGLGVVSGGFMFQCSLGLVRKILSPECTLIKQLGQLIPVELAVGMNGRIWLRSKTLSSTITAMNAISSAEWMTEAEIRLMVHKLQDSFLGV